MTEEDETEESHGDDPAFAAWLDQLRRDPRFVAWLDAHDDERDEHPPRAA